MEHSYFLISLNNIGYPYSKVNVGNEELLAAKIIYNLHSEILGNTHTATLTALSNLAFYHNNAGNYETALSLCEELCVKANTVYGAGHHTTLKFLQLAEEVYSNKNALN